MLTPEQMADMIREYHELIAQQVTRTRCSPQEVSGAMAAAIRTATGEEIGHPIKRQCVELFRVGLLKGQDMHDVLHVTGVPFEVAPAGKREVPNG